MYIYTFSVYVCTGEHGIELYVCIQAGRKSQYNRIIELSNNKITEHAINTQQNVCMYASTMKMSYSTYVCILLDRAI